MHISRVDLNLFIVFDAIYTEGSITRASVQMHLTQPAISHALGRLRQLFDDPLFQRQGHPMAPTPLARSIIEPVRLALRGLDLTLNGIARFDPATSKRQFSLSLRDVLEATVLAPLIAGIADAAPLVDLAALRVERRELEAELAAGTLDCAIDVLLPLSADLLHTRLATDQSVVLARRDHPRIAGALDLDAYLAQEHVLASSRRSGPGLEDFELSRLGLQRRVRLRCQNDYAACRVVGQTDLVLTMPERFARIANEQFGHQILPFPLPMPGIDMYLYWHANVERDPANRWLRAQIVRAIDAA